VREISVDGEGSVGREVSVDGEGSVDWEEESSQSKLEIDREVEVGREAEVEREVIEWVDREDFLIDFLGRLDREEDREGEGEGEDEIELDREEDWERGERGVERQEFCFLWRMGILDLVGLSVDEEGVEREGVDREGLDREEDLREWEIDSLESERDREEAVGVETDEGRETEVEEDEEEDGRLTVLTTLLEVDREDGVEWEEVDREEVDWDEEERVVLGVFVADRRWGLDEADILDRYI
jgi:hypothetical protein